MRDNRLYGSEGGEGPYRVRISADWYYSASLMSRLAFLRFAPDTGTPFCLKKKAVTSTLPAWSV